MNEGLRGRWRRFVSWLSEPPGTPPPVRPGAEADAAPEGEGDEAAPPPPEVTAQAEGDSNSEGPEVEPVEEWAGEQLASRPEGEARGAPPGTVAAAATSALLAPTGLAIPGPAASGLSLALGAGMAVLGRSPGTQRRPTEPRPVATARGLEPEGSDSALPWAEGSGRGAAPDLSAAFEGGGDLEAEGELEGGGELRSRGGGRGRAEATREIVLLARRLVAQSRTPAELIAAAEDEGNRLSALARDRAAQDLWRRLASLRPDLPELRARLADQLAAGGQVEEASQVARTLTSDPQHAAHAFGLLAEGHERAGNLGEALAAYESALAHAWSTPRAQTGLERVRAQLRARDAPATSPLAWAQPTLDLGQLGDAGARTADRYRLLSSLGRGGSGAVYLARDEQLGRDVALKILHPHVGAREEERQRFLQEARSAARLRHPGVVRVFAVDAERRMLAMEYLARGSLRDRLGQGALAVPEALSLCARVAGALAAVHRAGMVHRDVKPGNILLRAETPGTLGPVLSDFGIAHLSSPATGDASQGPAAGTIPLGTLLYMSPEARRGQPLDGRADLYGLGVILHELLVGAVPFPREVLLSSQPRPAAPPLPALVLAALPEAAAPDLSALLGSLLAERPDRRPATAADAARSLEVLARAAARHARQISLPSSSSSTPTQHRSHGDAL